MRSVVKLIQDKFSVYAQMLMVVAAFALMGFPSFMFVSNIERGHLLKEAEDALASTEAEITANLMEPETYLSGYSETIRRMILNGESVDKIASYMWYITDYIRNDKERMTGFMGTYGIFDAFDDKYLSTTSWIPPEDFIPRNRIWYKAAVAANGKVVITEPYTDARTSQRIISFARRIFDDNGNPLGVISLDIDFNRIFNYAVNLNLTPSSYGVLVNDDLRIVAHPDRYIIDTFLYEQNIGLAALSDELRMGHDVSERRVKNYRDEDSIVFFRQIKYGWNIGIIIPIGEYYKSVNSMATFLVILGVFLATILSILLYRISAAKKKSDFKTHQKSNFLATMSHEIRTPLNAIMGITEIQLQNKILPLDSKEAFAKIYNSSDLLLSIINDILDLSKIEAGKLELTPVKYEVASLINDIVQLNRIRFESKPIDFKLIVDENVPSILVGDELRIKQVLNNIISNAFKYTERGGVTLSVGAEVTGRGGAVHVTLVFQVSDTGQGMSTDEVNRLFDEYTRFNLEANRATEGTGLGMSITRNLIHLMYGKISVKSIVDKGTTITVRLPQKNEGIGISGMIGKELAENLQQFQFGDTLQAKKAQITYDPMPYGRVLIVDDVETNLYVAKGLMAPYGLKIDMVTSGFEAISKIKEGGTYDIIFMDHMMPGMDGIEATRNIRNMGYTNPIVALTANALAGHAEMFLENGFDGFISKPIDIRQLNVSLNRLIRDKQPADVIEKAHQERAELVKLAGDRAQSSISPELAGIFTRDAEKAATVLDTIMHDNYRRNSDMQMFIINVHAMKSALANIGELELSAAATRLEQAGRDGDVDTMAAGTPGFLEALRAVIEKVRPKDEEGETVTESEDDKTHLREKLLIIQEACTAYDKKTAKNTLNELKEKAWSPQTKELLNTLSERILHSDFEEAAAVAGNHAKNLDGE